MSALNGSKLSRWIVMTVVGLVSVLMAADCPPPRSDKAVSIFDGTTLEGWEAPPPLLWSVKDGCLTAGDGIKMIPYNDFLCTKKSYSNFILHLKIKLTGGEPKKGFVNSGIQIRTSRNLTGHEVCGYQCDYGEPEWYAAIYDEGRRNKLMMKSNMAAIRPALHLWDWNDYVIKADGLHILTWINGVQGLDYEEKEEDIASDGIIGIQIHGGGNTIVQVKDVFIEELPATPNTITWEKLGGVEGQRAKLKPKPKPQSDAAKPAEKTKLAVLKNFNGWEGDEKVWREENGVISAEVPSGQTLASREDLAWKNGPFHTASGREEERMHREAVDLKSVAGKRIFIRLIDESKGGWGASEFR